MSIHQGSIFGPSPVFEPPVPIARLRIPLPLAQRCVQGSWRGDERHVVGYLKLTELDLWTHSMSSAWTYLLGLHSCKQQVSRDMKADPALFGEKAGHFWDVSRFYEERLLVACSKLQALGNLLKDSGAWRVHGKPRTGEFQLVNQVQVGHPRETPWKGCDPNSGPQPFFGRRKPS